MPDSRSPAKGAASIVLEMVWGLLISRNYVNYRDPEILDDIPSLALFLMCTELLVDKVDMTRRSQIPVYLNFIIVMPLYDG
jgi:hypothetical protein